jgi:hypothetical protein
MEQRRRIDLFWLGEEVEEFKVLAGLAKKKGISVREYIKGLISRGLNR